MEEACAIVKGVKSPEDMCAAKVNRDGGERRWVGEGQAAEGMGRGGE